MNARGKGCPEKLAAVLAVAALVTSLVCSFAPASFSPSFPKKSRPRAEPRNETVVPSMPTNGSVVMKSGARWDGSEEFSLFDGRRELARTNRVAENSPVAPNIAGDVELVATGYAPFRVQLTGFIGTENDAVIVLTAADGSSCFHGRVGDRFVSLGVSITGVEIDEPAEGFARVTLHDDRSGGEVFLDSRAMARTRVRTATLQPRGKPGEARVVGEGEVIALGAWVLKVDRIGIEPASISIVDEATSQRIVLRADRDSGAADLADATTDDVSADLSDSEPD